jgi:hypothetical protein
MGIYFSEVLKLVMTTQKRIVDKPKMDIVWTLVALHPDTGVEMG